MSEFSNIKIENFWTIKLPDKKFSNLKKQKKTHISPLATVKKWYPVISIPASKVSFHNVVVGNNVVESIGELFVFVYNLKVCFQNYFLC